MPEMQYEAAWCITNIATGTREQVQCLVEKGVIQRLVVLMKNENEKLKNQAIWALGNISGECIEYRDASIAFGIVPSLVEALANTKNAEILKNGSWALLNTIRGKPVPDYEKIKCTIPIFCKLILEHNDEDIVTDSCWGLTTISENSPNKAEIFMNNNILPKLVQLLGSTHIPTVFHALRCIGTVLVEKEEVTQLAINAGVVPALAHLINIEKVSMRKEAAWAISNITAGSAAQLQTVINSGLISKLVSLAINDNFEVRRESIWCLSNATTSCNAEQLKVLVESGVVEALCGILVSNDARTIAISLEGLETTLKKAKTLISERYAEEIAMRIEKCNGLTKLENLQTHSNTHIYHKAVQIIEEYFGVEDQLVNTEVPKSISIFDF
jgi:hypothetical protein